MEITKPDLSVALVQANLAQGEVIQNLNNIEDMLGSLREVDLIVLPEMFNTGFSMDSRANSEPVDGHTTEWMQRIAQQMDAVVCGSLSIKVAEDDFRNRLLWVSPDGTVNHYDKRHLFRMAGEDKRFTPGDKQLVVELKGWKIRPLVCYDLRFPAWARDAQNTDLIIYVACWPQARAQAWNTLLAARAIENQCYVLGINRVGMDHNNHYHSGDTQALDYLGNRLVHVQNQETVVLAKLKADSLHEFKTRFPAYMDADKFYLEL